MITIPLTAEALLKHFGIQDYSELMLRLGECKKLMIKNEGEGRVSYYTILNTTVIETKKDGIKIIFSHIESSRGGTCTDSVTYILDKDTLNKDIFVLI